MANGHRQAEAAQEAPDDALHERDRQEHRHERQRGREHRQADLLGRETAAGNGLHLLLVDEAEDVLEHDDGVVDDDADRQREREQRDDVEREALDHISANVPMIEIGMAIAAMIVLRRLPRNSSTTSAARRAPRTRCSFTASTLVRIVAELSRTTLQLVAGRAASSDLRHARRAPRRRPRRCSRPTACGSTARTAGLPSRCWRPSRPPPRRPRRGPRRARRIGWPRRCARRSPERLRRCSTRPLTRKVSCCGPVSTRRRAWSGSAPRSRAARRRRSARAARSCTGSSTTLICRLRPPMIVTWPTPEMFSSAGRTSWSAISVTSRIGRCRLERDEEHRRRVRDPSW